MKRLQTLKALVLVVVLAVAGALGAHNVFAAGSGQIYITPASTSVQNGAAVSVAVRINPGVTVDGVQFTLSFDASKLKFNSVDASSSPFNVQLQQTSTASSVTVARGQLSGGVSSDSLVATISFQAIAGSGSSALTLSNANATSSGTYTNPAVVGGSISLTTPTVTPPPVTPPPVTPPSSGGSGSGSSSGASSGSTTKTTPSASATATATAPAVVPENGSSAGAISSQFTQASISFKTTVPTQAYIKYGLDKSVSLSTALSALATSHDLALDSSLLTPGTTYYYQVVIKDAAGQQTATEIQSFTTKGYTLHVAVLNKSGHPLAHAVVELHSATMSVKTDDKGIAVFTNVAPGSHHVSYTAGSKQYSQPVTVNNTVNTVASTGAQSAAIQNLSVQFAVGSSSINVLLPVVIIGLLAVVALAFFLRGRFTPVAQHPTYAAATVAQPASIATPLIPNTDVNDLNSTTTAPIDHAHGIQTPHPGSVITPVEHNEVK